MDWIKKTTDWQVCCLGQVAGGAGVAGGFFLFCFYSAAAGGSAFYGFSGVGMGVGGNMSGVINPADYGTISAPWSGMSSIPYCCGVNASPVAITSDRRKTTIVSPFVDAAGT